MQRASSNAERLSTTVESCDVFISYSHNDKDFVLRLNDQLVDSGRRPWVDWKNIPPSLKWLETILLAIGSAHAFIFVISPDSITSSTCLQELQHALSQNKKILPVLYREVEAGIPADLASRHWIRFTDNLNFAKALKLLCETLDANFD